jgi:molybdopterin-guanine dinucleotide biosynthesis protein A
MGRDKATLMLAGETLLMRTVRTLKQVIDDVFVVGLRAPSSATEVRIVPDALPDFGPLAGILAALRAASTPYVLVVACDMPLLQPRLISFLLSLAGSSQIIVPRSERSLEPLHAVYAVECEAAIEACIAAGEHAIRALFARVTTRIVEPDEWRPYDPDGVSTLNANTPEEWQALSLRAADRGR